MSATRNGLKDFCKPQVSNPLNSHSPPKGGAGSPLLHVRIYSPDDLERLVLGSIAVSASSAPGVIDYSYIPLDAFMTGPALFDDSDLPVGKDVVHMHYSLQKRLLSVLLNAPELINELGDELIPSLLDEDRWRALKERYNLKIMSTQEYHRILAENPDLFEDYWDLWASLLKAYLDRCLSTWVHVPVRILYDDLSGYAFVGAHYLARPMNMFLREYKDKKLSKILKFKLVTQLAPYISQKRPDPDRVKALLSKVDKDKLPALYQALNDALSPRELSSSQRALLKLKEILEKPILFVSFTMKLYADEGPAETFVKYKRNWNWFFTGLKRLMKRLGWEHRYYVKGVEVSKSGYLHVHLVFLGVEPSHDFQMVEFKRGVEKLLQRVGFGYVNDLQLVKPDYNLVFRTKTDFEKEFLDADGKPVKEYKILDTLELPYMRPDGSTGTATIYFLKTAPNKKAENWERVVNYIFKYPLKGDCYEDVKDDPDALNRWLRQMALFWVFGVRRWEISRELSKLLDEAFPPERRLYLFNNEWNFLAWFFHANGSPSTYSSLRDSVESFRAFVLDERNDETKPLLRLPTLKELYEALNLSHLANSPVLTKFRAEGVIPPEVLGRLIYNDLFNSLISLRYGQLVQLITQQGVVEGG